MMNDKIIEKYFPGVGLNELAVNVTPNNDHKGLYRLFTILAVAAVVGIVYHELNKEKVKE